MSKRTISGTVRRTVTLLRDEQLTITGAGMIDPRAPGTDGIVIPAGAIGDTILNGGSIFGAKGMSSSTTGGIGGSGIFALETASVTNTGTISGGTGGGGSTGGTGGTGVYLQGGTLINAGTISGGTGGFGLGVRGTAGDAVRFGSAAARLVVDPGAVFNGSVVANETVNDVLELASGGSGTLAGLGQQFTGFQTIQEDAGANWTLTGTNMVAPAAMFTVNGSLTVYGAFSVAGTLANNGAIAGGYGISASNFIGYTAVSLSPAATVANSGVITGGYGGYAINSGFGYGTYGTGGVGVDMNGGTLTNAGRIAGGRGTFGDGFSDGSAGGNAIDMAGGVLVNSGIIAGGAGNYGRDGLSIGYGGTGVDLTGGTLTNNALISGGEGGSFYEGVAGAGGTGVAVYGATLVNAGSIQGGQGGRGFDAYAGAGGTGVVLGAGGSFNNLGAVTGGAGGLVNFDGYYGANGGAGLIMSAGAVALNAGSISGGAAAEGLYGGKGGAGVFASGGTLTSTGLIKGGSGGYNGGAGGAGADLTGGALINAGDIIGGNGGAGYDYGGTAGGGGAGVLVGLGASLTNTGLIRGGDGADTNGHKTGALAGAGGNGVYIDGGDVTTSGFIYGGTGGSQSGSPPGAAADAVLFGSAGGRLTVEAGAVFQGAVVGDSAANCVLELGGQQAGTLSGLGSQFTGFSSIYADSGATWTLAGLNVIAAATTLVDQGLVVAQGTLDDAGAVMIASGAALQGRGSLAFLGSVTNNGEIAAVSGSILLASPIGGSGTLALGTGTTLLLLNGAASGQTADFLAGTAALDLANPLDFLGKISGFHAGDTIDLLSTAATGFSFGAGVLTVQDNAVSVAHLDFTGSYTASDFMLTADGAGGTLIKFV